jgi:hypothetical protein
LLTARRTVLNKRRDVENGVRTLLREAGLKVGTPSRKDFPARVRELAAGDAVLTGLVESLLSVIIIMTDEVARLTKRGLDEVPRVIVTCSGNDSGFVVDDALGALGLARKASVRVPFLTIVLMLVGADRLAILPRRAANSFAMVCPLVGAGLRDATH